MPYSILIVDDDHDICEILQFNLRSEGYEVETAYSAEEALQMLAPHHSLILLDVMMGGMSGYKLAEQLRAQNNQIPIIFLTARDTENDVLTGFSVGGDDYISKPFSLKELSARVRALLKRVQAESEAAPVARTIEYEGVVIDTDAKELWLMGENIPLTKTEFELLLLLASRPERIFSREEIIDAVWAETPYITERTVDVHITRLRKKLGTHAGLITNKAGYGYRFNPKIL